MAKRISAIRFLFRVEREGKFGLGLSHHHQSIGSTYGEVGRDMVRCVEVLFGPWLVSFRWRWKEEYR